MAVKRPKPPPKALRDLWDQVPKMVDCKGLCHSSCGPVPASPLERKLIEERAGKRLGSRGNLTCSMLTPEGRCSVYSIRPLICRIWGAARGVPCVHGCKPERLLTLDEANKLMRDVLALSPGADPFEMMQDVFRQLTPDERARHLAKDWKQQVADIFEVPLPE
jgi:Fe-S-cluster containining protein